MDKKYVITATIVALLAVVIGAFLLDDGSHPHAAPGSAPTDPFDSQSSQTSPSPSPSNQIGADLMKF